MNVDQAVLEYLQERKEKMTGKRPSVRVRIMSDFLRWYLNKSNPQPLGISVQEKVSTKEKLG